MLPRANWPSLTPLLRMSNLMSARGSLRGEPQIPAEANVCLRRHITYCVLGTHLSVPGEPLSSQPAQRHWWALRGTSERQENLCALPSTLGLFHTFFDNAVFGVYLFTLLLKSEESMRALEVFREQLTHLYQIMQVSGCSRLNINRITNVFQQRLGLP